MSCFRQKAYDRYEPFHDDASTRVIENVVPKFLAGWWHDRLGGTKAPPLLRWDELSSWRWGGVIEDPERGIIIHAPRTGGIASLRSFPASTFVARNGGPSPGASRPARMASGDPLVALAVPVVGFAAWTP